MPSDNDTCRSESRCVSYYGRYEEKARKTREKYLEIKGLLDQEVAKHEQQAAAAAAAHAEEVHAMQQQWRQEEAAAQAAERAEVARKQALNMEMQELNRYASLMIAKPCKCHPTCRGCMASDVDSWAYHYIPVQLRHFRYVGKSSIPFINCSNTSMLKQGLVGSGG